jgi:D-beta-D-heptose 7-phosphate kinase/D-beta-D-heptose 1-phosphate adenosyltransferase
MRAHQSDRKVIAVIGDVMIDRYLTGRIDRISPEAPVPILLRQSNRAVAGGAANVAVNIAALGCEVRLVATTGEDQDGVDLEKILIAAGVSTEELVRDIERPTTCKTRVVSGRQQFFRIDQESTLPITPELENRIVEAARLAIAGADLVVLSDYAKGVLTDNLLREVIGVARASGKPVLVDPKRSSFEGYRGADIIKPNARELAIAVKLPCDTDEQVEAAAASLAGQLDTTIVVTRADAGLSVSRPGMPVRHFATSAVEVFDVSGAGDTALAALAVSIAEGSSIEEAAVTSNFAGGIAVGKMGTAVVSRAELSAAIARASIVAHHPGSLVTQEAASEIASKWRRMGERVVFTNGCFDLIHAGHIELLSSAAKEGTRLIIGLNSDASIRRLKGAGRPIQTEADRARIIGALRAVDLVVVFEEMTPIELIDAISPDVLVKGADYAEDQVVGAELVKSRGGRVALIPLVANRSSTRIIEKLRL